MFALSQIFKSLAWPERKPKKNEKEEEIKIFFCRLFVCHSHGSFHYFILSSRSSETNIRHIYSSISHLFTFTVFLAFIYISLYQAQSLGDISRKDINIIYTICNYTYHFSWCFRTFSAFHFSLNFVVVVFLPRSSFLHFCVRLLAFISLVSPSALAVFCPFHSSILSWILKCFFLSTVHGAFCLCVAIFYTTGCCAVCGTRNFKAWACESVCISVAGFRLGRIINQSWWHI